jgi:hypothetical protein
VIVTEPIKAGDLCEVVDGLLGKASPNLGLIVKVASFVGEHSQFGRIWRCDAEYAERGQPGKDVPGGMADFAQSWLRKIEPPKVSDQVTKDVGVTV